MNDLITHRLGNLGLELFDPVIGELDDFGSLDIDHMIVMLCLGMFEPRRRSFELMAHDHTLRLQRGQCAIYRRERDSGHLPFGAALQVNRLGMIVGAGQYRQQRRPLSGDSHPRTTKREGQVLGSTINPGHCCLCSQVFDPLAQFPRAGKSYMKVICNCIDSCKQFLDTFTRLDYTKTDKQEIVMFGKQMKRTILGLIAGLALGAVAIPAAAADKLKVVTTFTVIADIAQNVAGDAADVVSITRPDAEIHDYEPTPGDLVRAQGADLILWNGFGLERWFKQFFSNVHDVPAVVVSEGVKPIPISGGDYDGKGKPNPHAWMALESAEIYIDNIRDALSKADPDDASTYADNAAAYKAQLEKVIGTLRTAVRALPEKRRWLVTSEGAFSYLARDFGLKEAFLWPINASEEGTPQQVRKVIDIVNANDIPAVFSESTVSDKPARQVARETGAKYGGVLYVDSLSSADGPTPTYLDLLRVTSETVLKALQE